MKAPTPETDALMQSSYGIKEINMLIFHARKLERERNDAILRCSQIQLEAFKAGAAWAAAQEVEAYPDYVIVGDLESPYDDGARDLSKKIINELEKLKEIPK